MGLQNLNRWLPAYIKQCLARQIQPLKFSKPIHIMFAFVDHYEPNWGNADTQWQRKRVQRWLDDYPKVMNEFRDADGVPPQHSFFYPAECYTPEHLDLLADLCRNRWGEVEVHLHHDGDDEASLTEQLQVAVANFHAHGHLAKRTLSDRLYFGFIHGNWALNNARRDQKWCGVNDEIKVLTNCGCYADFTLPSAPSETQTSTINQIYYAASNSQRSKGHDRGRRVKAGQSAAKHDQLLMVQGPLALNWRQRRRGAFPAIENSDITGNNPPTADRIDLWVEQSIHVQDQSQWIFIKIHTHGAPEKNADSLLGQPIINMHRYLKQRYNDGQNYVLHYVTAREMVNIIKAAEAGAVGDPHPYRDYLYQSCLKKKTFL